MPFSFSESKLQKRVWWSFIEGDSLTWVNSNWYKKKALKSYLYLPPTYKGKVRRVFPQVKHKEFLSVLLRVVDVIKLKKNPFFVQKEVKQCEEWVLEDWKKKEEEVLMIFYVSTITVLNGLPTLCFLRYLFRNLLNTFLDFAQFRTWKRINPILIRKILCFFAPLALDPLSKNHLTIPNAHVRLNNWT